ncbi:MAG: nucleotidyltransferase family protein [Armatimonadia bacterium]
MHKLGAIIMANGEADKLACKVGAAHKALIDIEGRSMIERVAEAVQASGAVDQVVVACRKGGCVAEALAGKIPLAESEDPTFLGGMQAGFNAMPDVDRALLVTCDMPLLTPEAVRHFADEARTHTDADMVYAMVEVERTRQAYPETRRTAIRLKEGNYTAAGVTVVSRRFVEECGPLVMAAFGARKSKIAMARILGGSFLVRFALGMLSVDDVVKRAEELLGCGCATVNLPFAECGFDVDSEADLIAARQSFCRTRSTVN